ncbi:DNA repair protein [Coraliomargarita sinensis]|uniref:DNA repair protein n=1 Tax=Coraliomargarita sinensis TaxID=2174842 RepID=A0A317ZEJ8_9BACT|nr:AAA family ATPase [Coraliomargarita sinensis]PXA03884.1 DNA repair protein [Coraliomargarita sinensis]
MSTETYTKAKFWKCALQVNPAGYIKYRGTDHDMTEAEYNQQLLNTALENDIKVVGLADHGNVDAVDAIRDLFNDQGVIVFPGFEIASTEKAHFVCLFPEDTSVAQLNRYLGELGLSDPSNGVRPSRYGGQEILRKVEDLGGFAYAAHCTNDSGILRLKLNQVWQEALLKAAQIPATLEDLKNDECNGYRQVLLNRDPNYSRELPVGIINAKDVAEPSDLANEKASCLIKMTRPCFESFKLAFQDPESRVRLNSDRSEKYYSRIEKLRMTGGYLDGLEINFSEHLNAVIGGRGTGKSTLLESLRFALDIEPIGQAAKKQHLDIVKENLGRSKARVELTVRSSKMNGRTFKIARRYGEDPTVVDSEGKPSSFSPKELMPGVELYGQNEIYEIAQDASNQGRLLARFLEEGQADDEAKIREALKQLGDNRTKLLDAQKAVADLEDEVARIPKLEEEVKQFKSLGIEEKLKVVPLLETEKRLASRVLEEELHNLNMAFESVKDSLPDMTLLSDNAIESLPHKTELLSVRKELNAIRQKAEAILKQWNTDFEASHTRTEEAIAKVEAGIAQKEEELEKTFKELPATEGKSGREVGIEFQKLLKDIERIRPKKALIESRKKLQAELAQQRQVILNDLSQNRAERSARFDRSLKKLNRKLKGKMRLTVAPEAERKNVTQFLLHCQMENVGAGRLRWVEDVDDFSPVKLAQLIRQGIDSLQSADWGITPSVAESLSRLPQEKILQLEEIELPDRVSIELNTAHESAESYRPLGKLSTGQQCTAILHLLLLQNKDPLIMDQPEDNLDNAFIADRIVTELRSAKIARQFIFATHNANIPVFGDAEWIGVFDATDDKASMPPEFQGAIDVPNVKEKAAEILEGGRPAFNQRKAKYGF